MKILQKSGNWELREITLSQQDEDKQKNNMSYFKTGRYVHAGTYQQLIRNGTVVMSDTPDELRDFQNFIYKLTSLAESKTHRTYLLIGGLGLGCVIDAILALNKDIHITIIEQSADVILITAPKYKNNPNITIVEGDIYTIDFKKLPFTYYDIAWFDIWDYICGDNYEDFKKLRRRYARKASIKMFWVEEQVKRLYNHNKHTESMYGAIVDMERKRHEHNEEIKNRILSK